MSFRFLILLIIYSGCKEVPTPSGNINPNHGLPINSAIKSQLDQLINYKERLAESSSIYEKPKSYWIYGFQSNDSCFLVLMANFDYYNSAEMDGYFEHQNKIISIYDSDLFCYDGMVDTAQLNKGKISSLKDYFFNEKDSIPPPFPVHHPYKMAYYMHSADSLNLIYEGY